ncbi:MAG TPA: heavy-metal-associated domain-containing protein [Thermodesulfobacteriota bacterium]|nr:heavy-metal-associated domain-containing protein [Thermodesulfobacteriota bacterium]
MKSLKVLVVALTLIFTTFNLSTLSAENSTKQATLKIGGIYCSLCGVTVSKALKRLGGVEKVNMEGDIAHINYIEGKVKIEDMVKAVGKAGFKAVPLKDRNKGEVLY